MASQACPFCPFSHRDSYFLMHHVEVCHPETGESPFSAKEYGREESASAMDAPAKDDYLDCEYIPCECGEIVTLAEFPTHMELHKAEGMTFDSDALNVPGVRDGPVLDGGEAPFAAVNGLPPVSLSIALHGSSSILAPSSVMKPRSRGTNYKSQYGTQHCYEQPLGSPQSTSRNKIGQARHKSVRRLGKAELGPHAYEERMPASLRKQLERGAKVTFVNQIGPAGQLMRVETVANETHGVVPVLSQLCEQDRYLSNVFLCHPEVQHVVKMSKEGGFCGYRNIQMMISFIQATGSQGHENLPGRIPSIFQLQDLIEGAWDQGINSSGRIETGGIRGTRKYIGTPEAQALLLSLGIGCEASAFNNLDSPPVYQQVLQAVEQYFMSGVTNFSQKVCRTSLPPIYFQHPGHSLTIVGFERRKSGSCNLLVLDPMFKPSPGICRLIGAKFRAATPEKLLKAYRRGDAYLSKYNSFEILKLTSRVPAAVGWNA